MLLENIQDLFARFEQRVANYRSEPDIYNGIELDDAAVVLKRFLLSKHQDQENASRLNDLGKAIRKREQAKVMMLAEEVLATKARYVS